MAIMCSGKKCSVSITVFFFIILVAALWLVWFGAGSLLGKPEVENFLQHLSSQLSENGSKYGRKIKLTHGGIDIEGWGHEKKAVIHNLAIEVSPTDSVAPVVFTLSVDEATVSTDPYDFQKLLIKISKPVNILQNGNLLYSLVGSEPVLYRYMLAQSSAIEAFHHDFTLPKHVSVMGKNSGNENNTSQVGQEQLSLDFVNNPVINFMIIPDRNTDSLTYDLSGVTIAMGGQKKLSIGTLKSQNNEEPGDEEGRISGKYYLDSDNIVLYKDQDSTKPYALNVDTNTTADAIEAKDLDEPKTSEDAPKDAMAMPGYENARKGALRNREVVLNNFVISSNDFVVHAKGNFANIKGDPLPSGEINVDIENLPKFLESELVAIEGRAAVENSLAKITGQPVDGQEKASFAIKREKNGVLYIGNTSFEELMASLLSGIIMGSPSGGERFPNVAPAPAEKLPSVDPSNTQDNVMPKTDDSVQPDIAAPKP